MPSSIIPVPVHSFDGTGEIVRQDLLAVEEPLEIRIGGANIAITMRTPGQDADLAAGFLFTEGILTSAGQILEMTQGDGRDRNVIDVNVREEVELDLSRSERRSYMTSSCGVCGKASIEMLRQSCPRVSDSGLRISGDVLLRLPGILRDSQAVFARTGGLHAAGLFDAEARLLSSREDVGRHNAVDKLIGAEFLEGRLRLTGRILMVSGRVSFELVQKAAMAGVPFLAAVGAPSSLAVETALRFGMTLAGFVRDGRFNVYSGAGRMIP